MYMYKAVLVIILNREGNIRKQTEQTNMSQCIGFLITSWQ